MQVACSKTLSSNIIYIYYYPKVSNIYKFILINIPSSSIFYALTKFFIIYFWIFKK